MISIVMSGMCDGCEYADLVLDSVSSTAIGDGPERKSWWIRCEHMLACLAMKKKMERTDEAD